MSKNIFNVLAMDDSDDENPKQNQRLTKDQRRKKDKVLRQAYGDTVSKEYHKSKDQPKNKNYNRSDGKRVKDRKSGTGRQAHGGVRKNGGFGKGNEALENKNLEEIQEVEGVSGDEKKEKVPLKTVDEYMSS